MQGYLSLILHAHLPYVRHPEHPRFLEETWLFEAITDTYVPLLQMIEGWSTEGIRAPITLTLTPTLCSMLLDPLLQARYREHLRLLLELAEKESLRTMWEKPLHQLAVFYLELFRGVRDFYEACDGNLVRRFATLQAEGAIQIATCAATHALLPLFVESPSAVRAQILVARDHYRACFRCDPEGIWLPECAYVEALEPALREAGLRWFVLETHGLLNSSPAPRYGTFAPVITPGGLAAFGRDPASARQVWSRDEGYPGDPWYRDFYRDIGFDLDLDYLKPYLAAPAQRGFTGIKYHRITGGTAPAKAVYQPQAARQRADEHAAHFLQTRIDQVSRAALIMDRAPLCVCPYDAELFGHWWYEGLEFLNFFVRKACFDQRQFTLITPSEYLRQNPTQQQAVPAASSWGERGYWGVWLNDTNHWIYPHLRVAQDRMTELVTRFGSSSGARPDGSQSASTTGPLQHRAVRQAARELLLAQASDWPFIMRTGTSPDYARKRITEHLMRFTTLYEQLMENRLDQVWLRQVESQDPIFPELDLTHFVPPPAAGPYTAPPVSL